MSTINKKVYINNDLIVSMINSPHGRRNATNTDVDTDVCSFECCTRVTALKTEVAY